MNFDKNTAKTLKNGGANISVTPSTALLNQSLTTSPVSRMLAPYETDLLRQSAREIAQVAHEVFLSKDIHQEPGGAFEQSLI